MMCKRINLLFLHLCVKSELEEQRSQKVVTVKSIEFDLLLLVSLLLTEFLKPSDFGEISTRKKEETKFRHGNLTAHH